MTNTPQQLPAPTRQEFLNWVQDLGRFGSQPEFTSKNDGMDMSIIVTTHSARYGITAIMPATERPESPRLPRLHRQHPRRRKRPRRRTVQPAHLGKNTRRHIGLRGSRLQASPACRTTGTITHRPAPTGGPAASEKPDQRVPIPQHADGSKMRRRLPEEPGRPETQQKRPRLRTTG